MKQHFKVTKKLLREIEEHIELKDTTKINSMYYLCHLKAKDIVHLCCIKVLKVSSLRQGYCEIFMKIQNINKVIKCNILEVVVGTRKVEIIEFKENNVQQILFSSKKKIKSKVLK